jgi:hypothetical protein
MSPLDPIVVLRLAGASPVPSANFLFPAGSHPKFLLFQFFNFYG